MKKVPVNPWSWQEKWNFSQGWKVQGWQNILFISGQCSLSAEGQVVHEGDFEAQAHLCFQNLRRVVREAGVDLDSIVRLRAYLIRMGEDLLTYSRVQGEYFGSHRPAQTVVQVGALALPGLLLEVEGVALW